MSQPARQVRLVLETGVATIGSGSQPQISYAVMGRNTRDALTNKTLTDPSNTIAASQLAIGGSNVPLQSGGNDGDVLTKTPSGLQLLPPTLNGASPFDVVRVPFTAMTLSGGTHYFTFGTPVNVLGTSASTITVAPAVPVGSKITCTKLVYSATMQIGLQYITQAAARRTFGNITANGVALGAAANSVPAGFNNFRQGIWNIQFGLTAGTDISAAVITDATPTVTLNSGYLDLSIVV